MCLLYIYIYIVFVHDLSHQLFYIYSVIVLEFVYRP